MPVPEIIGSHRSNTASPTPMSTSITSTSGSQSRSARSCVLIHITASSAHDSSRR